ncbi:MAG: hypothetical protein IJ517_03820 [Alphaproteobacteria bacterium]|nr:hypothetical protein [Alphaproteobacteria bacterium]
MRHFTISILSVFVVLPALANARLPVVNLSSGGVSARAAFGEVADTPVHSIAKVNKTIAPTRTRAVVSRTATKAATPVKAQSVDSGEQLLASNDVLAPRRPSNDLWARNDLALRMPTPDEFSVIRSDSVLPEESLDAKVAVAPRMAQTLPQPQPTVENVPDIDSQIARLVELQKRANDSVRNVSSRVIAAPIAETKAIEPQIRPTIKPEMVATSVKSEKIDNSKEVSLSRLVVPMDDDVVVRSVEKNISPRIVAVRDDMTKMSPSELRKAFRKTFLSENKHLSTYSIDDSFDVASDMSSSIEGFTAQRDLSEGSGIRPLEIKIKFRNEDSALSRENYTLLTEYAGIVVNKPTRAIQVAIPQYMTKSKDERKLAARRLAIVEQVLTDNGVSQHRIVPVLSTREEPGFVLRIISSDQYETLTQQKRDIFGDTVDKKTYKSMSW